jgi:hypothetical protein
MICVYIRINMYNKEMILTYPYYDKTLRNFVFDSNFDIEDVREFEDLAEDIYRLELLNVFSCTKIDDVDINHILQQYPKLAEIEIPDPILLFSYDLFFITHECIKTDFQYTIFNQLKDHAQKTMK